MLSVILLPIFCQPVGWSNDCICTSSSLTTPPTPSLMKPFVTIPEADGPDDGSDRNDDGNVVTPPQHCTDFARSAPPVAGCAVIARPRRVTPIASISSMNAIAPP